MGMQGFIKKNKGFTLIETIIALAIIGLIAVFLLPSLQKIMTISKASKDEAKIIYALEMAIEKEKTKEDDLQYGRWVENVNGVRVTIIRGPYIDTSTNSSQNLDKIRAISGNYELELIEVVDEKAWFYTD